MWMDRGDFMSPRKIWSERILFSDPDELWADDKLEKSYCPYDRKNSKPWRRRVK
jgi:hypothetical protein